MDTPGSAAAGKDKDDLLVEAFKGGDEAAFDELYGRYKDRILNYIYRMIGDRAAAEDIAQEAFLNVHMNIGSYRPQGQFKSWVYKIASNLAKNELRRRSYKINVSISAAIRSGDKDLTVGDTLASGDLSAEAAAENEELKKSVEDMIGSLPPKYREVLVLCVIDGLSYDEAAKALNTNAKTISSRLARARAIFIKRMQATEGRDAG